MKKIMVLALAVVLAVIWFYNAGSRNEQSTQVLNQGTFTEKDLEFIINDRVFLLNTDVEVLIAVLGKDYEVSKIKSTLYEGYDKAFKYDDITINTYPMEGKDMISEILLTGDAYATSKGIAVGSSVEEVLKAYGHKYLEEGEVIYYSLGSEEEDIESPRIIFEIDSGRVVSISYFYAGSIKQ